MATLFVAVDARRARQGAQEAQDSIGRIGRSARDADGKVRTLDRGMDRLGKTGSQAGRLLGTAFAGIGAIGAFRQAARTISSFEENIAVLGGVSRATDAQLKLLRDTARELGATTRFSASEAADGLTFLARAGLSVADQTEAIRPTLDLASAGLLGLGEAADIASNTLAQFKLEASETGRVGDVLINTANSANTNVQQLAQGLKFVGPVAGALNKSLENTSAALGVLGDSGIQASQSGTNLRGIILGLISPTDAGKKALDRLGLSLDEINPEANDLSIVFERLRDANLDAGAASDIFGRRNAAAALVLSDSAAKVRELTKANEEAEGTASRLARTQENTLAGSYRTLKSAVEELFLATGDDGLAGALREVTDTGTDVIRILNGTADAAARGNESARLLIDAGEFLAIRFALIKGVGLAASLLGVSSGALAAARGMTALNVASNANPYIAAGKAIATVAAGLIAFSDRATDAERNANAYRDSMRGIVTDARAAAQEIEALNRAQRKGDIDAQQRVLRNRIEKLNELEKRSADRIFNRNEGSDPFTTVDQILPILGTKGGAREEARQRARIIREAVEVELGSGGFTVQNAGNFLTRVVFGEEKEFFKVADDAAEAIARLRNARELGASGLSPDSSFTVGSEFIVDRLKEIGSLNEGNAAVKRLVLGILDAEKVTTGVIKTLVQDETAELEKKIQRLDAARVLQNLISGDLFKRKGTLKGIAQIEQEIADLDLRKEEENRARDARRAALQDGLDFVSKILEKEKERRRLVEQTVGGLRDQTAVLQEQIANGDVEARSLQLILDLKRQGASLTKTEEESLREQVRLLAELEGKVGLSGGIDAQGAAGSQFDRQTEVQALQQEQSLLFLTNEERERAIFLEQVRRENLTKTADERSKAIADAEKQIQAFQNLRRLDDVFQGSLQSVGEFTTSILQDFNSLGDAAEQLFRQLQQLAIENFVTQPLLNALGPAIGGLFGGSSATVTAQPNAQGNIFTNVPFAQGGGLIDRPITFPLGGGRRGIAGEAGAEAIMPLTRTASGDLGVKTVGGGGAPSITVNINGVRDYDSFRRSKGQIASDMARMIKRASS